MKKISLLLLLVAGMQIMHADDQFTCPSHVFVPRSITTDLVYVNALSYYRRHHQDKAKTDIYTGTLLYQNSSKSKHLGSAFLLGNGNTVTVAQDAPADVNSAFLGLSQSNSSTPFSSRFTIKPQRKVLGFHGNWYFTLDNWWCGLWLDISAAIVNVRHTLNCLEVGNFSNEVPGILTVADALSNPAFKFGKFFCGLCNDEKRRTGIDDIQLRLGYNYIWGEKNVLGIYLIGTIPTGRKPTAEFVFEPLIGSRHGSIGVGFVGEYNFDWCWCDEDSNLALLTDFNYRSVFNHRECRTFDLIPNGAFSRFLPVALQNDPSTPFPGVNFLTQKVNVQPRGTIQWWLALNFEHCDWDIEIGYNLYWRQKERIKAGSIFPPLPDLGIFDLGCIGLGCASASTATIDTFTIVSDGIFVPLTIANLNAKSAVAGRALTNKLYVAGSLEGCWCNCISWFCGIGASYEFVADHDKCNAVRYWAGFAKAGISF